MELELNLFLWSYLIAYCIHILEEYSSGDGFVTMMQKRFWPEYSGRMFFGFNTMLLTMFTIGLICFDAFDGLWLIWPLSFAFMFVTNGIWHLIQTILLKEYSPGLITSPIYWVIMYFIVIYYYLPGGIEAYQFFISIVIGSIMTIAMFLSAFVKRRSSIKIKNV